MTFDLDQEGQGGVYIGESRRKDIPGAGHSMCKGPVVRDWSGRNTGYVGRGRGRECCKPGWSPPVKLNARLRSSDLTGRAVGSHGMSVGPGP